MKSNVRFILALAFALLIPGQARICAQINTDRMMMVGRNALYFEDYVLSIQYFNQVINAKPYLNDPYFFRAVAKLSLEDYAGAENDCSRAISINPYVVNSYQVRGLARVYQGKYDLAVQDYMKALSWDPENVPMRHNLVLCYMRNDNSEKAQLQVDTLLEISPDYTPAMAMQSSLMMERKDTAGALEMLDKAVSIDKYEPSLLRDRAIVKATMKLYDDAEEDLTSAISYSPDEYSYYIDRALVRFYRNNLRGAMADYDIALELNPSDAVGHYNRGVLRSEIGDDNKAIEDFDIVIEAQPDNIMAIFNRGLLRDQTGDLAGAVQDYTTVLAEYPNFIYGYELRSAARYKLGDRKGGEQDELVVMRDRTSQFAGNAQANATDNKPKDDSKPEDDDPNDNSDQTRKESDNDVWNYRKIVVTDRETAEFSSEYRGRVQNRNIDVRLLESYMFTWFSPEIIGEMDRAVRFSAEIERINNSSVLSRRLQLSDRERPLSESQIRLLFEDVDRLTLLLDEEPENMNIVLARAIDFFLLQDLTNAQADFTNAILIGGDNLWAAYFGRSVVRMRLAEMQKAEKAMNLQASVVKTESFSGSDNQYQLIFNDLNKTIDLAPEFAAAYYNRANLQASAADYRSAIADYSRAIEIDGSFAEAYYNRGLAKVFQNRIKDALSDFGTAGELGIYSAYNVMKRFSN